MKEIIVGEFDPQPAVRKNAETANDWEYKEEARYLYDKAVAIRERLIDPIARIDRKSMPDPVISFDNLRNQNTLAAYRLVRNPQGLQYEIILNTEHYIEGTRRDGKEGKVWRFGEWALLESLTHEQIHEWQQTSGKDPVKLGKVYHNKEFVEKCESIGLHPKLGPGYHTRVADGNFALYMKELGIKPPTDEPILTPKADWYKVLTWPEKPKGTSTLKKWECEVCHLKVRVGIKGDPELVHDSCSEREGHKVFFVRADVIHQTMYQAPEPDLDSERNQKEIEKDTWENYNPWEDSKDLGAYLEPYQNGQEEY